MSSSLSIEREGSTVVFTLARPEKRNALSADLVEALIAGVGEAHSAGARVMVFQGEGKNFSAGFDFTGIEAESEGDILLRFVRIEILLQSIAASPCLTLALAHGRNFGAGVDLVAACRRRIASADATFRMPGLHFGLVLGTRRFAALVGPERARRILQEAETFDAARAVEVGFLEALAEPGDRPAAIRETERQAEALDDGARAALYRVLGNGRDDEDLADLVRSAAAPGLKRRIAAYLGAT